MTDAELTVQNTTEHLVSLRGELSVVSSQLAAAIEARDRAQAECVTATAALEKLRNDASDITAGLEVREQLVSAAEIRNAEEKIKIAADRYAVEEKIKTDIAAANAVLASAEAELKRVQEKSELLTESIHQSEKKLASLTSDVKEAAALLSETNEKIVRDRQLHEADLEARATELLKVTASVEKKKKELAELSERVAAEKIKATLPMKRARKLKNAADVKMRDARIMVERIRPVFERLYPGQKLMI